MKLESTWSRSMQPILIKCCNCGRDFDPICRQICKGVSFCMIRKPIIVRFHTKIMNMKIKKSKFKFRICCYKAAGAEFITKHRHRPISNNAKSSLPLHRPIVGCQGRNGKELQLKTVIFSSLLLFSFQQEQQSSSGSKVWLYFKCWGNFKLSNLRSRFWAGSGSIRGRRHLLLQSVESFHKSTASLFLHQLSLYLTDLRPDLSLIGD